jgi:hypothetical protein
MAGRVAGGYWGRAGTQQGGMKGHPAVSQGGHRERLSQSQCGECNGTHVQTLGMSMHRPSVLLCISQGAYGGGSGAAALAERRRQRGSSAATVGNLAAALAARGRWRQRSRGIGCRESHEFFYPWGRERVQIPEGRAYIKNLYQAYNLLKKNKSAHLLTCRQISNLLIFPAKTKN